MATIVAVVGTLVVVMSGRAAPAGARRPPARREGVGLWSEAGFCCHKNLYDERKHRKTKESPRGPESPVSLITPWNRLPSSRQFVEQSTNPSTSEASLASARQVRAPLRAATMLKPLGTSHFGSPARCMLRRPCVVQRDACPACARSRPSSTEGARLVIRALGSIDCRNTHTHTSK